MKLLRIDSSPRKTGSVSRQITDILQQKLESQGHVVSGHRDVFYDALVSLGDEDRFTGYFTPEESQTEAQKKAVAPSTQLALEFAAADGYIIAAPMHNFGVTAGLKAYIDAISRAGISFNYLPEGPIGLLKDKKAYVVVSTGGTPVGAEYDYTSTYLRQVLGFLGITDVTFIAADLSNVNLEESIVKAQNSIEAL